ncbi:MAG: ATP-binding cassette domain-containing protein [Verrucomicrobiales bacterium]|nr:ATP-binding cassette domain-containing protein [Verrucomicrobiales bacterium]
MNPEILTASFRKQFPGGPEIGVEDLRIGGGITVLFGASGSGKTTVLRCLAGLERPENGSICFGTEDWFHEEKIIFHRHENAALVLCRRITHCFRISRSRTTSATA